MHPVELALRAAALAQLIVLLAVLWRNRHANSLYTPLALLLLCIAGYAAAPITVDHGVRTGWSYPAVTLASAIPLLFWYFCYCVFGDRFRVRPWVIVVGLLTLLVSILAFCDYANASRCSGSAQRVTYWLTVLSKFAWMAAALTLVARDWRHDLVEQRRRLRSFILSGIGCYILAVMVAEVFVPDQAPVALEILNMGLVVAGVTAFSAFLLVPARDNVFSRLTPRALDRDTATSPLAGALLRLIDEERVYTQERLTIDSLAARLSSTPYQLRAVINGELGHRNFNTFINGYRVREVARRMDTDQDRDTPVLTLALDVGFRSMAPFNRAFKDVFEVTPSDYRRSL